MPFNIGFARSRVGGETRVFRTTCKTREELEDAFDTCSSGEKEVVVGFLSFDSSTANVLDALCGVSFIETDLMAIIRDVRNTAPDK